MGSASELRLSHDATVRLPKVVEALNIGYAIHSADDPALRDKLTQEDARLVAKKFLALEAEPGSPDEAYLNCVRAIVLSHARGISRRKERYIQDLKAAQLRRRRQRNSIRQSRRSNDWLSSAWRLLGPLILGLSGYLSAHLLAVVVPDWVSTQTGSKIPAIPMGLVFVAIGRSIGFYFNEMQRNKIESEYNSRCYIAFLTYQIGNLKPFLQ